MPNRIIREGIIDSEAVNSLSPEAEVFYRRLMSVVDDFGRFDGRTTVLRCRLYPLQLDKVSEASLERWIAECVDARLIRLYHHNGKPYILFHKLGGPRAKASKYPPPPDECDQPQTDARMCAQTPADARMCDQPQTDARMCAQTPADARMCAQTTAYVPYSYSSSDSSSSSDSTPTEVCSELPKAAASEPHLPDSSPIVLTFPTVGKGPAEWHLTEAKLAEYRAAFPGVDVLAQCRAARQWSIDNPTKRKTARGMPAFLTRWLTAEQNRGSRSPPPPSLNGHAPRPTRADAKMDEVRRRLNGS